MHGKAKEQAEIDGEKELIETSTVQAMGKNKYGNVTTEELQNELQGKATVEKIRKKIVVTINDSQRSYYVDDEGNVFEYEYVDLAIMENGSDFYNRMSDYRESILTVSVLDNMNVPENAYRVFDVSKEQNETVKAWLVENAENSGMYDLYIGGNEGVEIRSCGNMFRDFSKCTNINLECLYTEKVAYFVNMFNGDFSLREINIASNFVSANATNLMYMFYCCQSLKNIDTSNWDTSNVTNMFGTFRMCQSITSLDLSNWDTQKVTAMDYLFQYCQKLKTIYVSNKWNNDKVNSDYGMFQGCSSLVGAISFDSTKTTVNYANYDTGYFTYKAIE